MDFKEMLTQYQDVINMELSKCIRKQNYCPEEVLNNSVEYSLMAGGKRIRPILVLATYKLFAEDYEKALPYALALEMVHNFSLIHDDLPGIDNDNFRHGKPTNHIQFNEATAILAGDKLLNMAYILISEDLKKTQNSELLANKLRVFNEFTAAVDKMIIGEYLDTEAILEITSKELLEYIHTNKTGAFLRLSVRIGAILSNADEKDIENISNYADKIGLAFQIKEDILSEEGNEQETGKPVGNDKEAGKCTYVSVYGLDEAKRILNQLIEEAMQVIECYGEKSEFLKNLAEYIRDRKR